MKVSKQTMLGSGVFFGGTLLLYSVIHQVKQTTDSPDSTSTVESATYSTVKNPTPDLSPLTADIATEQKILAQKQQEREQRVNALDRQAEQYLTEQQRIEAAALARSRAENQLYADKNTAIVTAPIVTPRSTDTVTTTPKVTVNTPQTTDTVATPKPQITSKSNVELTQKSIGTTTTMPRPTSYQIKKGEGLIALSRKYDIPVSILAKANNISHNTALNVGQTLIIPSNSQVTQLQQTIEQEASNEQAQKIATERAKVQARLKAQQDAELITKQKADKQAQLLAQKQALKQQQQLEKAQKIQAEEDKKAQYQTAQQSLKKARQTAKETDAKGTFGVQVALAADDQKADEIVKKLRSAGYSVKTSKTTRGTRVVVGPETGKIAALALKDKVNNDSRVNLGSAWVLYW